MRPPKKKMDPPQLPKPPKCAQNDKKNETYTPKLKPHKALLEKETNQPTNIFVQHARTKSAGTEQDATFLHLRRTCSVLKMNV